MSDHALATGKLPPDLLGELLEDAPPLPAEIVVGPRIGEDACGIAIPGGTLVAATDPITLTGAEVGAHAVVINANDVAVMGVRPEWFLAAVMLPAGTRESEVRALFAGMRRALSGLGAALVGGHTEVTDAVRQPIVVGQMLGLARDGRVIPTGGLAEGDVVVQVGEAPIEAAAVLAEAAARTGDLDPEIASAARSATESPGISVVEAALACARMGAHAMHDPTEGGLATGLQELALASEVSLEVDAGSVIWFEPGVAVCRALGCDPWGALASGALLAGFSENRAGDALAHLHQAGFAASAIGRTGSAAAIETTFRNGGALPRFERDEVARFLSDAESDR